MDAHDDADAAFAELIGELEPFLARERARIGPLPDDLAERILASAGPPAARWYGGAMRRRLGRLAVGGLTVAASFGGGAIAFRAPDQPAVDVVAASAGADVAGARSAPAPAGIPVASSASAPTCVTIAPVATDRQARGVATSVADVTEVGGRSATTHVVGAVRGPTSDASTARASTQAATLAPKLAAARATAAAATAAAAPPAGGTAAMADPPARP